jgi:hypothetical protein
LQVCTPTVIIPIRIAKALLAAICCSQPRNAPPHAQPGHKAIKAYYQTLEQYRELHATGEGAVETAFQRLLADTASMVGWVLHPKETLKRGKAHIIPDGTLHDKLFNDLRKGYWEAEDTKDNLDAEITKKIAKGYPLNNTIFEDTRIGVLYQGGKEVQRLDLTKPKQLCDLLNLFYSYREPEIESFEQAVEEFKERVPELAQGLVKILAEAHEKDKGFQAAFDSFFAVCQQTLNPNISRAAVDEMLVQHLLTERLIRTVVDNPDFTRRNVIAAEIEKVIDALVKHALNRDDFLRKLDRFYRAIESFQGYSVTTADTHGIVYTPQEIVDFMCARVPVPLPTAFGPTPGVLDRCL